MFGEDFGLHQPELTFTDDLQNVLEEFQRIGAEMQFQNDRGESKDFRVVNIEDGNHPLAGKVITYNIIIVNVRDPTTDEMAIDIEYQPSLH